MKILHVLDHSLPLHSGYTFRSQSLFRAQRDMGFEPVIVTSPKHEADLKGEAPRREEINGFTYYRSGATPGFSLPFIGEARLMHVLSRRILEVAKAERPAIIHAHSPVLNALPALWAGRRLGLPVVYEIRAFWEDAAVDHGTYAEGSWKYKLTQRIETMVCTRADQVAILCDGLKQDLVRRHIPASKITPVFNGVDITDFRPVPPDAEYLRQWNPAGRKVIGFIGSFYRYEGLDLLVRAFARIAKEEQDAVLLLVGGGEMEGELKQLVAALGLGKRVIMPGRIPHERVPGVYSMIDVLAYPRYSMRLTELVTPLKPLEAMAMGKALVASDVGGHKELIRHGQTGLLFKAGDEAALAGELKHLLTDGELRETLQRQGRDWVARHHTWEKTTAVYHDIYARARVARGV
ncbi:glycosyltransferase, exosortase A system-associated [Desulfoprunum benzoelyticum]|uniref:PEP-CTERM/exosortase A-associated glycosyltransferase n=1 Tax=Desulfoprunum benzoelyticum TaxID=1506996 RepID=A0A840V1C5_9BACT|nr:TIGR04063 family PEP-CTERM/XrtA system glycosyltransferase [Desulfoprunum benzoelyticum]MBB5346991.1 PEP-CTERM/exosortase A-associated glycosyltransferase [Desulfoprunum benzoelyticum]MBM9531641.1 glycosyltransferase, exosortase A system-associated [Desulfoprunum benzoelyticum]